MDTNFTVEDIKNSVEYRWRKKRIRTTICIWAILAGIGLVLNLVVNEPQLWGVAMLYWLIIQAWWGVVLYGPIILTQALKARYLLKNYNNFTTYEIKLDRELATRNLWGKYCYTLTIVENGVVNQAETNSYFSNSLIAKFPFHYYDNQKVIGLFDKKKSKFYVIKKVGE